MNDVTPADAGNKTLEAALATPPETPVAPAIETPADPKLSDPPQEHDWKKRFDGVDQAHKQLSEKHQRVVDTNVKLVEKNPGLLDDLADTDAELADEVSKKLHDKDYDTYRKDKELEGFKTSDPDKYAEEKRFRKIEKTQQTQIDKGKKEFLESKGVKDNEFDPNYKKVQAELKTLSPEYVEDNPIEAWKRAYSLAFPSGTKPEDAKIAANLAANTNKKGGLSAAMSHETSKKSPGAQAFGDQMSKLTG